MGRLFIFWMVWLPLVSFTSVIASPSISHSRLPWVTVDTVPEHDTLGKPYRSSVESIPLRSLRDEGDERVPLRDAVEKTPIPILDQETLYKFLEVSEDEIPEDNESTDSFSDYYGAAGYLNSDYKHANRKIQDINRQEMQQTSGNSNPSRMVVCYLESWAAYRAPPLAFTSSLVPTTCTHLHYAFASIHPHTFEILPGNEDYDIVKGGYRITTSLKTRNPGLKVIISVGGDASDRLFSDMVQEPNRRSAFINSAVNFLREHDFDGLDLHWQYPGEKEDSERKMLTTLLYELRERFASYGLLLSTVLPPFRYQIEDGYNLSEISGAVDYVILEAWDMTDGKRDQPPSRASQHSPLRKDPGASSRDQRYDNIEFLTKFILRQGMAADKLVIGIPFFGRSYTLSESSSTKPGALIKGWGNEGIYTQKKGLLAYFEICMHEREGVGVSGADEVGNAYAVFGDQWVSYDNPRTISEKMKFIMEKGLAGAAAWSIDMDDFRGFCGTPFPLLTVMSKILNGEAPNADQSSLKIGSCVSNIPYLASDQESCAHFRFCTGTIEYRIVCENNKLYDPSTGFCGHQDVAKCFPGQSLRISLDTVGFYVTQAYRADTERISTQNKYILNKKASEKIVETDTDLKRMKENDKLVVCYMTSWAFYRRGEGKFVPENIDTRLCTHVVYAYASLSPDELIVKEFDPWTDINNNLYDRVTSLTDVKVLLGVGGWTDSAGDKYSRLVSSSSARTKFIVKLISLLKAHNFKGVHFDWNYPVCWQSNCKKGAASDKANFAKLMQELSKALHNADMVLGIALSGYKEVIDSAYDLPALSKAADFLSTMTYDYHGGWETVTGHHTPMKAPARDPLPYYSVEYAVKALISGGVDPKKLLLGLSFYGQSYRLADLDGPKGPGAPAAGPGEPGEFTKQPGMLAYYEICYRVKNLRWKTGQQENAGPYAYSDNQWVGYDDPKSVTEKVNWALSQGLGGVTAWAIDMDDFSNRCCAEPSPLLRAAGRALGRSTPPRPTAPCEKPPEPITPPPPTTPPPAESDGSMGASGGSHDHHDHTSTTWPNWKPPTSTSTTQQAWWPSTTSTTTTSTTTTTTTKRPPTTSPVNNVSGGNSKTCASGEYSAADECTSYLQCVGGNWRKHSCAPGLHWSAKEKRCDWPSYAKCTGKPISEASTATSTLAPMTSRPPPPTTTTRRTTTMTTTKSSTTTSTTTRTTTTTPRTTTRKTTPVPSQSGTIEGGSCIGTAYHPVDGDCNAYLHCDGKTWRKRQCAPSLHWSAAANHCDWPMYAMCNSSLKNPTTTTMPAKPSYTTRPTTTPASQVSTPENLEEGGTCKDTDTLAASSTCDTYLLCVSGKWRKQLCPPGLHWDKRTKRCDWVEFAMCQASRDPMRELLDKKPTTTTTMKTTTTTKTTTRPTTTTKRPATTESSAFVIGAETPDSNCRTGTYHTHPRCEKFYICVNGNLITQSCAPGLVWNIEHNQCDFPNSASCTDRHGDGDTALSADFTMMQLNIEPTHCNTGEYAPLSNDCNHYRHCLFGKFEEFGCSAGLHWNQEKQICDWPRNVKCKRRKPTTQKPTFSDPVYEEKPMIEHENKPIPATLEPFTNIQTSGTAISAAKPSLLNSRYKLVCYYTNWSWYRPGIGKYGPEDIDSTLCTHIVYAFAVLGRDGLITAHDTWGDYDNQLYEQVVAYKRYGIKVSLAIGGWNDSAGDKYSKLVNNPEARTKFVVHALQFLEKHGFDGLDLDWEYPKCWQVDCSKGPDSDKDGFSDLIRELHAEFKPRGLLLSAAVSANRHVIDAGYDVPVLAKYLDWIAVMTYDYHGQWDKKTGHVAPLYYHSEDDNTYFNSNYTIHYWIKKGAPASKLIMGIPMYGQTFTLGTDHETSQELLKSKDSNGLNAPAVSGGEAGEYTRVKGFMAYYEICEKVNYQKWTVVKDPQQRIGPYAYKGNQWVSYDDREIIKKKVNFVKSLGLGGGMIWALDLDDFRNRCGEGKYPLANVIKKGLLDPKVELEKPDTEITKPIHNDSPHKLDDDFDIEVRPQKKPAYSRPVRPNKPVNHMPIYTTSKPTTTTKLAPRDKYKVVCYYTNWAYYRPGSGKYTPNDVDSSLCTHIVYAFAVLDSSRLIIKPQDVWLDVENKFYEKLTAMKNIGIKVLLGLGGWNDSGSNKYSKLVNNAAARRKFVVHAIEFLQQYGFDGLNLDWQYPKCWQGNCEKGPHSDKQGYSALIEELHEAFRESGLLLAATVSSRKKVIDEGYDVTVLNDNLDWISLMTYDYHGQWDKATGHHAPMYTVEEDDNDTLNVNYSVHYWIKKGADKEKLILGIPAYGQSFSLTDEKDNGIGALSYAGGEAGDETRSRGFLSFYEICERIRVKGWQVIRDPGGRIGPYATFEDQWVSFDDDYMVRHKAEYVRSMNLGGAMLWSMDLDDFSGKYCGCGRYPLLNNINHVLRRHPMHQSCHLEEIQDTNVSDVSSPETEMVIPITSNPSEPDEDIPVTSLDTNQEDKNDLSLDGKSCSGIMFKEDETDCSKYYLCINGHYAELSCPAPLHWNKNHCDWPAKSRCKNRSHLRLTSAIEDDLNQERDEPIIACYFTNWAYYREGNGSFGPEHVDPTLCTHIIYSYAHLDPHTHTLVPGIPELDVEYDFYGKITELRRTGIKVLLAVGGLEDSTEKWGKMAANVKYRKTFIKSVVKHLQRWNFDGLQLAWQYPVCKKTPCDHASNKLWEKDSYNVLLLELSKALRVKGLEFSAMVSPSVEVATLAYDPYVLSAVLDWVTIAANDFYASENGFNSSFSYWSNVLPTRQLVVGLPAFGRTYDFGIRGSETYVQGPGTPGNFTKLPGFISYYEICLTIQQQTEGTNTFYEYLSPEEVWRAAVVVSKAGVRGAALWALDLDDFHMTCACAPNPLLRALHHGLLEPSAQPPLCL